MPNQIMKRRYDQAKMGQDMASKCYGLRYRSLFDRIPTTVFGEKIIHNWDVFFYSDVHVCSDWTEVLHN